MLHADQITRRVGGRTVFEDLSLVVQGGDAVVIQGPSGAGKTILLRALASLDPLDGGTVSLDGQRPTDVGVPVWRTRVLYVSQRPPRLPHSAGDFLFHLLAFSARRDGFARNPIELAARWALPKSRWRDPFVQLSGGEQQRIMLALALASGADFLLLDEPTSTLDEDVVRLVEEDLRDQTVVWVTHDRRQADRVATDVVELRG